MSDQIAIHESKKSDKVIRFEYLDKFKKSFVKMVENNTIWSVYENKKGKLVAVDIWQDKHHNILK